MKDDELGRVVPLDHLDDSAVGRGEPDVRGWEVYAADGRRIGEVDNLLIDTEAMKVRYLDVGLDDQLAGVPEDRHILIPIGYARLDAREDQVCVDALPSDTLLGLPTYTHGPLTRDFEARLRRRFDDSYQTAGAVGHPDFYAGALYDESRFFRGRR